MSKKSKNLIYRVTFLNHESVIVLYAKQICESDMYGFIEVEELIFGNHSTVVVDPSEERLKTEFTSVKRTYIPVYSVIRIDEVDKEGISTMTTITTPVTNVRAFPQGNTTTK